MSKVTAIVALLLVCISGASATSPDLLVADREGSGNVLRYDGTTGAYLGVFANVRAHGGIVLDMAKGADGDIYVSTWGLRNDPSDVEIQHFDGLTGQFVNQFPVSESLNDLNFGPDGNLYGSDFWNDRVRYYDSASGNHLGDFVSGGLDGPTGSTFGPDGNLYVSSRITGQVLRYDGSNGDFIDQFASPGGNGPQDLHFGPDGALWVANDTLGAIQRFDGTTGTPLGVWASVSDVSDGMSFVWGPDNDVFVACQWGGVKRYDGGTGALLGDFVAPGSGGLSWPTALLFHTILEPTTLSLSLDIKPGSCPNPLNLKSRGKLPVALLGTEDFDVSLIDVASITLARADGVGGSVSPYDGPPGPYATVEDVGTPFDGELCDCHEVDGDGIDDLSVKFSRPEVVTSLQLREFDPGATVELVVSGQLQDGTPFSASDCILIVPQPDFDEDNDVDQSDFGHLQACYRGPMKVVDLACQDADIDGDGDVDISDFGWLQRCISGAAKAVDSRCAD